MKSDGLRLEDTQVTQAARLFNLAAIALVAAARTIQLVDARDGSTRPASDVADQGLIAAAEAIGPTLEGKTARQKNPYEPGSLAWLDASADAVYDMRRSRYHRSETVTSRAFHGG